MSLNKIDTRKDLSRPKAAFMGAVTGGPLSAIMVGVGLMLLSATFALQESLAFTNTVGVLAPFVLPFLASALTVFTNPASRKNPLSHFFGASASGAVLTGLGWLAIEAISNSGLGAQQIEVLSIS